MRVYGFTYFRTMNVLIVISLLLSNIIVTRAKLLPSPVKETSMNRCIESLVKKHAPENALVLISLTEKTTSLNFMLENFHRDYKWTIIIEPLKQGRTLINDYMFSIKRPGFFLLYTDEVEDIRIKLRTQKQQNVNAKFLIVPFLSTARNYTNVAEEAVKLLEEENIINGIVFLPDPENNELINGYTWKNSKPNCLRGKRTMELRTRCAFGTFSSNTALFPNKYWTFHKSCTILAGAVQFPPFAMQLKNNTRISKDDYFTKQGIEINLLNLIARMLKIKVLYQSFPKRDWGHSFINGTATGNLLFLTESKLDLIVGYYELTWARTFTYHTSRSYLRDNLVWCAPNDYVHKQTVNLIFDRTSCILVLVAYFAVTILMRCSSPQSGSEAWISVTQTTFSLLIGVPVTLRQNTIKVRMLTLTLLILSLSLVSIYQTYLTSLLAKSSAVEKYDNMEDIYRHNLKTYFVTNSDRYFTERYGRDHVVFKRWRDCEDFKACMDYVVFRRDSVFCVGSLYVKYVYHSYLGGLHCFGRIVNYPLAMLMRKGFPLHTQMDRSISRITAAGLLVKWEKDILRVKSRTNGARVWRTREENDYLKLENLKPVFKVLLIGEGIGGIVFILEMVYSKIQAH